MPAMGQKTKLSELDDVNVPSPADGEGLTYDAATGKWISSAVAGVTKHTDLTDKEVGGVIDHADGSVTSAKLADGLSAEPIADITLTAAADYIDITGLDINSHGAYQIFLTAYNPTASNTRIYLFVEGDNTPTNYYEQFFECNGLNTDTNRANNSQIGFMFAGETVATQVTLWRDPLGYARYTAHTVRRPAASVRLVLYSGAKVATVTNISSIRIAAEVSGALGVGTRVIVKRVA